MSRKRQNHMARADAAFSKYIRSRDGMCLAAGFDGRDCKGNLQCCHIIGRGELAIRTDPDNAVTMCASHHVYYTHNPGQWLDFVERRWPGRLDELRRRVRDHVASGLKVDWKFQKAYWEEQL